MNNKVLALLGLLAERPRYGYQIEADIKARGMREWTEIGFSSIYYLLNKAEELGWIKSEKDVSAEGPSRKVYSMTAVGFQEPAYRCNPAVGESKPKFRGLPVGIGFPACPSL